MFTITGTIFYFKNTFENRVAFCVRKRFRLNRRNRFACTMQTKAQNEKRCIREVIAFAMGMLLAASVFTFCFPGPKAIKRCVWPNHTLHLE